MPVQSASFSCSSRRLSPYCTTLNQPFQLTINFFYSHTFTQDEKYCGDACKRALNRLFARDHVSLCPQTSEALSTRLHESTFGSVIGDDCTIKDMQTHLQRRTVGTLCFTVSPHYGQFSSGLLGNLIESC